MRRRYLCPTHDGFTFLSGILLLTLSHSAAARTVSDSAATQPQQQTPFAALISIYLTRDAQGHSPTSDDIAAMATLTPAPSPDAVSEALPLLMRALASPDTPLRTFALTALTGLQTPPTGTAAPAGPSSIPAPTLLSYKPEIARILAPSVAQIATHLTEDSEPDRLLTAQVLGGFTPDPPAVIFPPLFAYLKRDDAISPVGLAVVTDLLTLGITDDSTAAITRYLRRPDQNSQSRSDLTDAIASNPHQSQVIDKALVTYLDSDDDSLRARVILSLPTLDLAPELFHDLQSRVTQIAGNTGENLQAVTAAKAIATCWTATKMTSGCPVYP